MLLPVFLQVKELAKMRACMSNVRQIGMAFRQYLDDNHGFGLPMSPVEYKSKWNLYVKPLLPYLKEAPTKLNDNIPQPKRVWICPGDVRRADRSIPIWSALGSSYMYPGLGAYISSQYNSDGETTGMHNVPRKLEEWLRPSRDMLIADWACDFHLGRHSNPEGSRQIIPSEDLAKSYNILMLDLHATTCSRYDLEIVSMKSKSYMYYVLYEDNPYSKSPIPPELLPGSNPKSSTLP
jgi:hypothetical protein